MTVSSLPGQVGERFLCLARRPHNIDSIENPSGKGSAVGLAGIRLKSHSHYSFY